MSVSMLLTFLVRVLARENWWHVAVVMGTSMNKVFSSILLVSLTTGCAPLYESQQKRESPKNIIVVIGDGMGPQQIGLLAASERFDPKAAASDRGLLAFVRSARLSAHTPFSHQTPVNDSACSATQLSAGCSCMPQQVGKDFQGKACQSLMETAHHNGKITGVVSDSRATHATPASFGVHEDDRGSELAIADKLASSHLDIIFSGGLNYFLPKGTQEKLPCSGMPPGLVGKRGDGRSLLDFFQERGHSILCSDTELQGHVKLPTVGLFAADKMADAFAEGVNEEPSLAEMTQRALELADNSGGFVLMVEAGQIDWAGHANDVGWLLAEMRRLDRVMEVISSFAQKSPDTLVVVTGDHETGGFGFSYKRDVANKVGRLPYQGIHLDYGSPEDVKKIALARKPLHKIISDFFAQGMKRQKHEEFRAEVRRLTGLSLSEANAKIFLGCVTFDGKAVEIDRAKCEVSDFYPYDEYAASALLSRLLVADINVIWGTGTHTSTPVLVFAKGPGSERFNGLTETTEVGRILSDMAGD
jgi:alkaline phosphatase